MLESSDLGSRVIVADLRLCYRICKKGFSHDMALKLAEMILYGSVLVQGSANALISTGINRFSKMQL